MNIEVEVDREMLKYVQRKLGGLYTKSRSVLRSAINTTATQTRRTLRDGAQSRYTAKIGKLGESAKLVRASTANLMAIIKSSGEPLAMPKFHVAASEAGTSVEVLSGSGMKLPVNSAGNKAFVATMKNKHVGVFQREGKKRLKIHQLFGPSVPKMLEMSYEGKGSGNGLKEEIERMLKRNIDRKIEEVLSK